MENRETGRNGFLWQQTPLTREEMNAIRGNTCRGASLRTKIILVIALGLFIFGAASAAISYKLYLNASVEQHKQLGEGVARLAASVIDPGRVDAYLTEGARAAGYEETKDKLNRIRDSVPNIEYVYVYRITEEGCRVVFDLDTDEVKGSPPGELQPFDESFAPYLPALLAGKPIDPIITDDTYGWLLTVYIPIYNDQGVCQCYAAADVSMNDLREQARGYLGELALIFLGIFLVILLGVFWLARYYLILPINSMAYAAGQVAYTSVKKMEKSLESIRRMGIHTGDEIENLYRAFSEMTENGVRQLKDIQSKTLVISRLRNALILALADVVESRDENTGQHIRKTAAYTKVIMEELRREGIYLEELTPEFVDCVESVAPLHDVGKVAVPDAILNKPGRLTEEEFAKMKTHTTEGGKIIGRIIDMVPESDYLRVAQNLATYHHEWWNGKGYPEGLSGDAIPLSARIMAVADVFDALVSSRSYKKGFPYDKALAIIQEESGTHFDPKVAEAFLAAKEEALKIADSFGEGNGQDASPA